MAAPALSDPIPSLLCPLFPLFSLQSALWSGLPSTNPQPLSAVWACGTLRGWYSLANPSILVPRKQPSLEATSKCPFSWEAKMPLFLYPPLSPKDVPFLCPAVSPPFQFKSTSSHLRVWETSIYWALLCAACPRGFHTSNFPQSAQY